MTEFKPPATQTVDARGLNCPLPILKARQVLNRMQPGEVLKIIATDPTSADDFPVFAQSTGNRLMAATREGETFIYCLKKG